MPKNIALDCNEPPRFIEANYEISWLEVHISKGDESGDLNGLFPDTAIRGMLEGKEYRSVDMVTHFVVPFIDIAN